MDYVSTEHYIQCSTSLQDKLDRIELVIMALLDAQVKAATSSDKVSYKLDTGQTRIEVEYKDIEALTRSLDGLLLIKEKLVQMLNNNKFGRSIRLVNAQNLNG